MQAFINQNFLPIPFEVLKDDTLTSAQKIMLCYLLSIKPATEIKYQNEEYFGVEIQPYKLSKDLGMSPKGIYNIINSLEKMDYLKIIIEEDLLKDSIDTKSNKRHFDHVQTTQGQKNIGDKQHNENNFDNLDDKNLTNCLESYSLSNNSVRIYMISKKAGIKTFKDFMIIKALNVLCNKFNLLFISLNKSKSKNKVNKSIDQGLNTGLLSKLEEEKGQKRSKLLEEIMKLPEITKHRFGNDSYKKSAQTLSKLTSGKFFFKNDVPTVEIKEGWMKLNNISPVDLKRTWTEREILYTFGEASKMLSPNYWPKDKSKISHEVSTLIYNPFSKTSQFLRLFQNGATPLESKVQSSDQQIKPVRKDELDVFAYEKLCEAVRECSFDGINSYQLKPEEKRYLHQSGIRMMQLWDSEIYSTGADFTHPTAFILDYCGWVVEHNAGRLETVFYIGPGTKDWRNYFRSRGLRELIIKNI